MPVATVTKTEDKFDLKTCPEGFVIIRRMTYGEKLERQDDMFNMQAEPGKEQKLEFNVMMKKAALKDFANLVVDHNLEDATGRKLDFRIPSDVDSLDPRIGEEIGKLIDSVNSFEELQSTKN